MTTVLLVPTARPTFMVEQAQRRAEQGRALLVELGATVIGPEEIVTTPEELHAAKGFLADDFDIALQVCASFSDATPALELWQGLEKPLVTWSFREPGPVGDRLWLNSLCGANLVGHAVTRAGGEVRPIHGDPDEPDIRRSLELLLARSLPEPPEPTPMSGHRGSSDTVDKALADLRGSRIGVLGDSPPGFTPSEYDPGLLRRLFGIEVTELSIPDAFAAVDGVPESARAAELAALQRDRPTVTALDPHQVAESAAMTTALRDWVDDTELRALAVRCWPEFPTQRGACPCGALSRLADEGTATACERDVYGAVTMLLLESLGSGPSYLVDTVDLQEGENLIRVWHCGSAATSLVAAGHEPTQSVHCNRKLAVVGDFPLRTGPVVLARLTEDPASSSRLRLLIAAGESIPAPNRFQGNTADIRLDQNAETFVKSLIHRGFPHHTVLAWTDVRPERAMIRTCGWLSAR